MKKTEVDLFIFYLFLLVIVMFIPWGFFGWHIHKLGNTVTDLQKQVSILKEK